MSTAVSNDAGPSVSDVIWGEGVIVEHPPRPGVRRPRGEPHHFAPVDPVPESDAPATSPAATVATALQ